MSGTCAICMESITNPICVNCLNRQIKSWFMNNKNYFVVNELTKDMNLFKEGGAKCIICRKDSSVCTYCFSNEVFDLLNERDTELGERFRDIFKLRLVEKPL